MRTQRIHITGASGAGSTTLARAVATALGCPCHDSDDYFHRPSDPPYQTRRPLDERLRLMEAIFLPLPKWVLSGGGIGWGTIDRLFDLVVFLYVPAPARLERLRVREARHFGAEALAPGGGRHAEFEAFLDWAAHYDDGTREGRSSANQLAALEKLTCPVLRLEGERPIAEWVEAVVAAAA